MLRTVTITDHGREGRITYSDGLRSITGYQEFGGADVVAIISMGDSREWASKHAWAVERRAEILRFIADEVVRQRAPSCSADIDDVRGDILLRPSSSPSPPAPDSSWVFRYGELKARFAWVGMALLLVVIAVAWALRR
jgi:hypothetical protein